MRNSFRKNFSQDYLRKLFNERQEKNKYLNKIINNDIYISMISESYKPVRDIEKYLKDNYNVHSRYRLIPNSDKKKITNNTINNHHYYKNENLNISKNLENNRYHFNNNINKNNNKSFDFNRALYGEKKHFPFITNKGSYLKIVNQSLVPNKERLIFMKKEHNNLENNKNYDNNYNKDSTSTINPRYNEYKKNGIRLFNNNNYGKRNHRTNNSMIDNTRYSKSKYLRNKLIDSRINGVDDGCKLEDKQFLENKEKHYNPHSFDYEGSRFGDNTYNYFLNEPMRGNYCGVDWKFPPLYNYNTKIDYGKSFPDL